MANQRTLEFIRQQLVDRWNLFRQEHPEEAIDLSRADLSETNLVAINLMRADLRGGRPPARRDRPRRRADRAGRRRDGDEPDRRRRSGGERLRLGGGARGGRSVRGQARHQRGPDTSRLELRGPQRS